MIKHLVSGHNVASRRRADSLSISMSKQQTHYKGYLQILIANGTSHLCKNRNGTRTVKPHELHGLVRVVRVVQLYMPNLCL